MVRVNTKHFVYTFQTEKKTFKYYIPMNRRELKGHLDNNGIRILDGETKNWVLLKRENLVKRSKRRYVGYTLLAVVVLGLGGTIPQVIMEIIDAADGTSAVAEATTTFDNVPEAEVDEGPSAEELRIEELEKQLAEAQDNLADAQDEIDTREDTITTLETEIANLETEGDIQEKEIVELYNEVSTQEETITGLEGEIEEQDILIDAQHGRITRHEGEIEGLNNRIEKISDHVEAQTDYITELENHLETQNEVIEDLREQLANTGTS